MNQCNALDAVFVSAPFFPAYGPSYAIEYLAAICKDKGLCVDSLHLHHQIGKDLLSGSTMALYDALKSVRYLGDYLVLARWSPEDAKSIFDELYATVPNVPQLDAETLQTFYSVWNDRMDAFLHQLAAAPPRVVALTATHYQLVASLWLADRIRTEMPEIKIVLGGYLGSLDTCRDLLARHPALDTIVFGEGDDVIADIVEGYREGSAVPRLVEGRRTKALRARPRYETFLDDVAVTDFDKSLTSVSYELSRGCYWDKCDFCNFNTAYGRFRRFNAGGILDQMEQVSERYGIHRFHLLDTSLPPSFAKQCDGRGDPGWDVFVEIMADWSADMLKALRRFGVRRAQVGIESFSDGQLSSMNKGMTVADNTRVLAACQEADVAPVYGLLVGRPGDTAAHYEDCIRFAENNMHLPPPRYISDCDLRPGSPLYRNRAELGISISFAGSAFEPILPATDHNCELRPSTVDIPSLQGDEIRAQRRLLERTVQSWQAAYAEGGTH